jgi:hypothetical protein
MLEPDEQGDPLADHLRDAMDPLYYALTNAEHAELDARDFRVGLVDRAIPGTRAGRTESSSSGSPAIVLKAEARTASGNNLEAA